MTSPWARARATALPARVLPLALAAAVVLWTDLATADSVTVQVQVIYATKTESGIDPSLASLADTFGPLGYSGYRRLRQQTLRVGPGAATMDLPDGRRLDVSPKSVRGDAADLRLAIYEGGRKLLASDVRLVPGGQAVLMGGIRHQSGVLLLAIQAMR